MIAGFHLFSMKTETHVRKKKNPFQPNEEFLLQRTWPNKTFDFQAYRSGFDQALAHAMTNKTNSALWQLEGPGNIGGRFNCIAVHPTNANIMYAGSANGGVWKTVDNGQTWNPMTDDLPYQAVGAIAINPSNPNEIWVGFGDVNISGTLYTGDGLYKSSNAGSSWNHVGLANSYVISGIFFKSSTEILVSTMGNPFFKDANRGIYKTTNGGASFTKTLFVNDSTGIIDVAQHPTNKSILYAASFSRIRTENYSLYQSDQNFIYKSTDFGQNWTKLSNGLPNAQINERIALSISKSNPNTVYALYGTSDGATLPSLYKTTDAGANWSNIMINTLDLASYGSFGWYFGKIYVDPNDVNTLYLPGVDLLYSTDGGENWNLRTPNWWTYEVHADGHFMHFFSSNDFIYCTDGGLYRTNDAGVTWTDIENIPNNQFYYVTENQNNPGEYAGGVQDNGTMVGNASTLNSYQRVYGGDGFKIAFTSNPSLVYSESQNGNIVFDDTYPSGNWQNLNIDPSQNYNWFTPYFVSPFDESKVFVGGQNVMRIDNAPYGSFTILSPNLHDSNSPTRVAHISSLGQSILDENKLYAGTSDGNVWISTNYGTSWTEITPFTGSSYYVTDVKSSPNILNNLYVCRSGYRFNDNTPYIFKSTNNGTNWTDITGNLPPMAVNDLEILPGNENMLFVATDAGVYHSLDGGQNWLRLGSNLPFVATLDIHFNHDYTKLIAGTFGRSMYTIDISTLASKEQISQKSQMQIFPNPIENELNIRFAENKEIIQIEIYNLSGQMLMKTEGNVISNKFKWNVEQLNKGMYILKVIENQVTIKEHRFVKR